MERRGRLAFFAACLACHAPAAVALLEGRDQKTHSLNPWARNHPDWVEPRALPELEGCKGYECMRRYVYNVSAGVRRTGWRHLGHSHGFSAGIGGFNEIRLGFTSQKFAPRTTQLPQWDHEIKICVPDIFWQNSFSSREADWATLNINDLEDLGGCDFARRTRGIVVGLSNVPAQRIDWVANRTSQNDEEYIRAYSRIMAAENPAHPEYNIEVPSAKAVIMAMDIVQEWSRTTEHTMGHEVKYFVVMGASKRAFVTWETCALDPERVRAIVPQIAMIRMGKPGLAARRSKESFLRRKGRSMLKMPTKRTMIDGEVPYRSLKAGLENNFVSTSSNRTSLSLEDFHIYDDLGIKNFDVATARRVFSVVDPYTYPSLDCGPKLIQNVGNDCWFHPDISRKYLEDVPDATFQMYGPHPHGWPEQFKMGAEAFIRGVIRGLETPKIGYKLDLQTGDISAWQVSNHQPVSVKAWRAVTTTTRVEGRKRSVSDFESARWEATLLSPDGNGTALHWNATVQQAPNRWVGYYIEFEYAGLENEGSDGKYFVTTQVSVMPNDDVLEDLLLNNMIERVTSTGDNAAVYQYVNGANS